MNLEPYVGMAYSCRSFDCADFVAYVRKDLFDHEVHFPEYRDNPIRSAATSGKMRSYMGGSGRLVTEPQDGDGVIMREANQTIAAHIGLYFFTGYLACVLHNSMAQGQSRLHTLQQVKQHGLIVEGYFRWDMKKLP